MKFSYLTGFIVCFNVSFFKLWKHQPSSTIGVSELFDFGLLGRSIPSFCTTNEKVTEAQSQIFVANSFSNLLFHGRCLDTDSQIHPEFEQH